MRRDAGVRTECYDCGLNYSDEGFQDLVVPNDIWAEISPSGDEGGLLCPTCLIRALAKAGIQTKGVFTSGPLCEQEQPE